MKRARNRRFQVRYGIWDTLEGKWVEVQDTSFETAKGDDEARGVASILNLLDEVSNG